LLPQAANAEAAATAQVPQPVVEKAGARPILTLEQAVRLALESNPNLLSVRAGVRAATARVDAAYAPLLPQVAGTAAYQRATANRSEPSLITDQSQSFGGRSAWSFGINATQTVFDFGQTTGSYHVAEANLGNTKLTEQAARLNLVLAVRTAYFKLSQQRALLEVAQETLANLKRHQQQIQGFVEVGARAPIDLVQSQADEQSGQLGLLNAESAYAIARASLAQTIGSKLNHDFDVVQEGLPAVAGEDGETATLLARAQAGHPQLQAALGAVRVQDLAEGTARGAYGPSLRVSAGVTESGEQLDALALNWNAQVLLNCPIFNGGQTAARVAEARANRESASAQVSVVTEQMRLAVEQARLGIRGSKFALSTAEVLVSLSRQRVNLAEGRYETGVGTLLELDDAVLKLASARAQQVQAVYNLAVARAQLLNALGVL